MIFGGLTVSNAQLLTQSNHAPVVGDKYDMYEIDSTGVTPGASGGSAIWNFTATPTRTTILVTNNYTTAASITSGSIYPVASVAKVNNSGKNFYTSSGTALNFWGGNITIQTTSADYVFSNAAIQAKYPMSLGTTTNSAFTGTVYSALGNGSISNGTATCLGDGTGTLNLPLRSFSNVIKVMTYTKFEFAVSIATGTVTQLNYDYYSPLTKFPLFTITSSTISSNLAADVYSTIALLNKDYQYVGINESVKEIASLNIFPNPAKNNFTLSFVNENADIVSYELTNTLGQSIKKENLGNEKGLVNYNINITDVQAGVYFVKVNSGLRSSTKKITIQ